MATEVSGYLLDTQPYSCIGIISVTFPDGYQARGTCTLVGLNDILTASHVVYNPDHGGWVEDYNFYFGADYNDITNRFEDSGYSYSPSKWTTNAWPAQAFRDSNNQTFTQAESQYDIALIGVNFPIGDTLGWLGIDSAYNGDVSANAVGYPGGATGMMQETVNVDKNPYYQLYESTYDVLGPGSSGGPLLIGGDVIGVKSTGSWWADIGFLFDSLVDKMDENNSLLSSSVADTTAPVVSSYSPADGATSVSTTANIVLNFNETIQRGTGNIILKTAAGTTVETFDAATSSRLSISGLTVTIDPNATLAYGTGYLLTFEAGTIKDLAGNDCAETITYDFTTLADTSIEETHALPGFDKAYYLNAKLAALQTNPGTSENWNTKDTALLENLLTSSGFTPESHYMVFGYREGLAPNAYFNAAEYKLAKATDLFASGNYDSIAAAQAAFDAKWPYDAYQHYLQYGSKEGINPSNVFDESSYYDSKLISLRANSSTTGEWTSKTAIDLKAAFGSLGITPLQHYITWGAREGIAVTTVPVDERVSSAVLSNDLTQEQDSINLVGVVALSESDLGY